MHVLVRIKFTFVVRSFHWRWGHWTSKKDQEMKEMQQIFVVWILHYHLISWMNALCIGTESHRTCALNSQLSDSSERTKSVIFPFLRNPVSFSPFDAFLYLFLRFNRCRLHRCVVVTFANKLHLKGNRMWFVKWNETRKCNNILDVRFRRSFGRLVACLDCSERSTNGSTRMQ